MEANNLKQAYEFAHKKSMQILPTLNPEAVCRNASVTYTAEKGYEVMFINELYYVINGEIYQNGEVADYASKVLIGHYLTTAQYTPPTDQLITFKELKNGGAIYCSNFQKRAIDPMVKLFGSNLDALAECGAKIGAKKAKYGHASIEVMIFPNVKAIYAVWEGDEEIPAAGNILFDSNVAEYLPVEDVVVAASMGSYALIRTFYQTPKPKHGPAEPVA